MKDMPKSVIKWYEKWIKSFPESWHPLDMNRFYMFVSILLSRTKRERNREWLQENIREDCYKLTQKDIEEYGKIYEHIKNFKNIWKSQQAIILMGEREKKILKEIRKYCKENKVNFPSDVVYKQIIRKVNE